MLQALILRGIKSSPYSILGVTSSSSKEQVKTAYYKLAKKYHPDINSSNKVSETQEYFHEISEAYKEIEKNGFKPQQEYSSTSTSTQYEPQKPRIRRGKFSLREPAKQTRAAALFELLTVV